MLSSDYQVIAAFTIPGEPVPKGRPRFARRGSAVMTYTPKKTAGAEDAVAGCFRRAAGSSIPDPAAAYGLTAVFCCGTRYRHDTDNLLKLLLDALNAVAWPDDDQVTEISARKYWGQREEARTEVTVYRAGLLDKPRLRKARAS